MSESYKKFFSYATATILVFAFIFGLVNYISQQAGSNDDTGAKLAAVDKPNASLANIGLAVAPLKTADLTVLFPYTDDNEGETLIIKSDKKDYTDFSGTQVYMSVTNAGRREENIIFLMYFSKEHGDAADIQEWDGQKWQNLEVLRGNIKINSDELSPAIAKRKPIPTDMAIKAGSQFALPAGQTGYFRSMIKYPPRTKGEFWIEALGDRGGYGLLDPWYDSSWLYRKQHTINAATGAGTNYQVKITAHYGSGSDSGGDDYLSSHSRTDFADVRFTDSSGTTSLDYWLESKTDSNNAVFWVEVGEDLSSVNRNIYIYYGNSGQSTSASNGTNTFLFFDDFSGASLDTNKWLAYNNGGSLSTSQSGGILSVTANATDPTKIIANVGGTGQTGDNVAMRAKFRATTGSNADQRIGLGVKTATADGQGLNYLLHNFSAKNSHHFLDDALAWGTDNGGTFALSTWYTEEAYYNGSAIYGRFDDGTWYSWTRGGRSGYMALNVGGYTESVASEWDFALIRKIVATEPAHGAWGSEETENSSTGHSSEVIKKNVVFNRNVIFKAGGSSAVTRSCDDDVWFCGADTTCSNTLGDGSYIIVKRTNESDGQWKTSDTACNTPQCGQDGGQNNDNLVADNTVDFSSYPARDACKSAGGRLPTMAELQCMYTNRATFGDNFGSLYYWSSTEFSTTSASSFYFGLGLPSSLSKSTFALSVRCVIGW